MQLPQTLFSPDSLLSFTGAVIAAVLVPNVLASIFKKAPVEVLRFISLLVAMGMAYLMAYFSTAFFDPYWMKWVVAFFNGLLIYLSALGANETLSNASKDELGELVHSAVSDKPLKRRFFATWFHK